MSKTYKFVILDENDTQHSFVTNDSLKLYAMLMSKIADETVLYKARTPQESMQHLMADIERHNVDFDYLKYGYVEIYQESDLSDSNYFSNFESNYNMLLEKSNESKATLISNDSDEVYILQSCNEWQEHSKASIEVVSTDLNMILAVIYEKILNGDMLYKFDNTEDSIAAFKEDLANEEFNSDLLTYGMIKSFDNMLLTNPLSLVGHPVIDDIYTELFDIEEVSDYFSSIDESEYLDNDLDR